METRKLLVTKTENKVRRRNEVKTEFSLNKVKRKSVSEVVVQSVVTESHIVENSFLAKANSSFNKERELDPESLADHATFGGSGDHCPTMARFREKPNGTKVLKEVHCQTSPLADDRNQKYSRVPNEAPLNMIESLSRKVQGVRNYGKTGKTVQDTNEHNSNYKSEEKLYCGDNSQKCSNSRCELKYNKRPSVTENLKTEYGRDALMIGGIAENFTKSDNELLSNSTDLSINIPENNPFELCCMDDEMKYCETDFFRIPIKGRIQHFENWKHLNEEECKKSRRIIYSGDTNSEASNAFGATIQFTDNQKPSDAFKNANLSNVVQEPSNKWKKIVTTKETSEQGFDSDIHLVHVETPGHQPEKDVCESEIKENDLTQNKSCSSTADNLTMDINNEEILRTSRQLKYTIKDDSVTKEGQSVNTEAVKKTASPPLSQTCSLEKLCPLNAADILKDELRQRCKKFHPVSGVRPELETQNKEHLKDQSLSKQESKYSIDFQQHQSPKKRCEIKKEFNVKSKTIGINKEKRYCRNIISSLLLLLLMWGLSFYWQY